MMIINPPSPFATLADWEAFLLELEGIQTDDDDAKAVIAEHIAMSKAHIADAA